MAHDQAVQRPGIIDRDVLVCTLCLVLIATFSHGRSDEVERLFAKSNLVAWCIVPFDAAKRNPEERAAMVRQLGLSRIAYDWRDPNVPEFEAEVLAYQRHGIEFVAFWSWHPDFAKLVQKHAIRPQFWITNPSPAHDDPQQRVALAGEQLLPLVEQTRTLGCRLGLYNHGDWGGEPQNLIAVCRWLRQYHDADHVGIVYNLHHGHDHLRDFAEILNQLKPYLLCLNLNGMNDHAEPKILPLGQGMHDARLLKIIADSGYSGPFGILDHREALDAEESLRQNLDGLERLVAEMESPASR